MKRFKIFYDKVQWQADFCTKKKAEKNISRTFLPGQGRQSVSRRKELREGWLSWDQ